MGILEYNVGMENEMFRSLIKGQEYGMMTTQALQSQAAQFRNLETIPGSIVEQTANTVADACVSAANQIERILFRLNEEIEQVIEKPLSQASQSEPS